jgi:hypothetical protein
VTGGWRKLHNEELCKLYSAIYYWNVLIKEEEMTCVGKTRNAYKILAKILKRSDHWEDPDIYWRIILKWILRKYGMRV